MNTRNESGHVGLRLSASGGEVAFDGPLFPIKPAPLHALELLDAESRLLVRAVGEHLPLELALQVETLRAPARRPRIAMNALAELVDGTAPIVARPAGVVPAAGASVGAAAERFARLTLAQASQTQRTYHGSLARFATWLAAHHPREHGHQATPASQAPVEAITADAIALYLQGSSTGAWRPRRSKRTAPRSTASPSTSTRSARSTRRRS